ncbi:MFS transporter [Pseudothermotoga thermarum]|uniref:Major facilitator superfamily MFS_1 n=1 Tax=Pseudothermotoga thermarum DSM 5069 TaxID=688269 RepID=F7YW09_9THEM|nr:MFS transporter [Pseudothermotoga thermarum]AEH50496.1 major facilitator superfamily MFS_1 [Pseudothermotoga thermarum DSM 5069]
MRKTLSTKALLNLEGVASTLHILLTQGAVFTGLALAFGLDEFLLGVVASFPMVAQVFQIIMPRIMYKTPRRVFLVNLFNLLSRSPWIVLMIFLLFPNRKSFVFVFIFAISQIFGTLAGNVWTSLVRDLIPENERGSFFGRRNVYTTITSLIAFYLYTLLIEKFNDPLGYELVIGIGMVGMIVSLWAMKDVPDVPIKVSESKAEIKRVLGDSNFVKLCRFYFFWNLVIAFTSPFFPYHLLKNVKVPFSYIGIMNIVNNLVAILFYILWGKLADKYGHKTVAVLGIQIVAFTPMVWVLMNQFTYRYLMVVDAVMSGIAWSAINLTFLTLPMEVAHSSSSAYFAVYATTGGIGGLIGAFLGGAIAKLLSPLSFAFFGIPIVGLQFMFLASGFLRLSIIKLLLAVKTYRYVPVKDLLTDGLSYIFRTNIFKSSESLLMRRFRKVVEEKSKENVGGEKKWRVKRWW